MNKELHHAAKALLNLIWNLPSEQWAFTFADFTAPEVRALAEAIKRLDDCNLVTGKQSATFGELPTYPLTL